MRVENPQFAPGESSDVGGQVACGMGLQCNLGTDTYIVYSSWDQSRTPLISLFEVDQKQMS